jgi:hypothetical protein
MAASLTQILLLTITALGVTVIVALIAILVIVPLGIGYLFYETLLRLGLRSPHAYGRGGGIPQVNLLIVGYAVYFALVMVMTGASLL